MKIKRIMTEDPDVNKEMDRLLEIFKTIDEDKRGVCLNLIQNAAFMAITLRKLQKTITENGPIEEYDNGGGQKGNRISPASAVYTKLIANYNAVIKQLIALLPPSEKEMARITSDPMADYLNT